MMKIFFLLSALVALNQTNAAQINICDRLTFNTELVKNTISDPNDYYPFFYAHNLNYPGMTIRNDAQRLKLDFRR